MKSLGFDSISNPAMLNTGGRFMTIGKGAEVKKIELEKIKEEFIKRGYSIMKKKLISFSILRNLLRT
ncbi:DUF1858 domain-containing protein [Clostridium thermarum]|uniref:DUF1858 domain-containing protein n=1 Tax=Clostridium thermarum TaxID=1716543 RepID=UPI0013CF7B94|nr:DUF1858 domain-containing protein [Clostridium thermarum]